MVEALRDIARHFQVLNLVAAHRHLVRVEHQDVRGHQHRIENRPMVTPSSGSTPLASFWSTEAL